jgi:teichuronic acid biosynthesis glycosyltransferase TuaG
MELVSIIMPYYQKRKYVKLAINSVIYQTYKNLELIIVYDDENKEDLYFLEKIIKKDKRIKILVNKKNLGAGRSRNKGIKQSKGALIAFLDSDDLWLRNKIDKQVFFMKKNEIEISHTSYYIIDSNNKIIGDRKANDMNYKLLLSSCDIGLSTVMLKKKLITNKIKFADIKTKEDYVLWLQITHNNKKILGLKDNLTKWRKLDDSLSSLKLQKIYDGYLVYKRYMKFDLIKSLICLLILSFNYFLKNIKNR